MELDVSQFLYLSKHSGVKDGKSAIWAFRYNGEWYFGLNRTASRRLYPIEFSDNGLGAFSLSCNLHVSNREEYSNFLLVTNLLDLDSSVAIKNIKDQIGIFDFSNEQNCDGQYLDYQKEYLVNAVKKTGQIQAYASESNILFTCEITSNIVSLKNLKAEKESLALEMRIPASSSLKRIKIMQNAQVFDLRNFYIDETNLDFMCKLIEKFLAEKIMSPNSTLETNEDMNLGSFRQQKSKLVLGHKSTFHD